MAASDSWRWFVRLFRRHAYLSLALAAGIAIGIGCRYPTGWALPDNTMAVFAAVIGALATAAAVVIGVDLQSGKEDVKEAARQAELRMRVKIMIQPFLADVQCFFDDIDHQDQQTRAGISLRRDAQAASELLRGSRLINEELDNDGLIGLTYLQIAMATIVHAAGAYVAACEARDAGRQAPVPVEKCASNIGHLTNALIQELSDFAGGDSMDEWRITEP